MTTIATRTISRLPRAAKLGAAACAITTVAALTPATVAQADPVVPLPVSSAGSIGGSAGIVSASCDPVSDPSCVAPISPSLALFDGGLQSIFQNPFIWFGTPNPAPPPQTTVFEFYPLALIPGFLQPLFGWFASINFEACVLGLTLRIGPYGTVSGSYSQGCA